LVQNRRFQTNPPVLGALLGRDQIRFSPRSFVIKNRILPHLTVLFAGSYISCFGRTRDLWRMDRRTDRHKTTAYTALPMENDC